MEFIPLDFAAVQDFVNLGIMVPDRPMRVEIHKSGHTTHLYYYELLGDQKLVGRWEILWLWTYRVNDILKKFEMRCGSDNNSIDYETYSFIFPARMLRQSKSKPSLV